MSLDENRELGAAYAIQKIGAGIIVDAVNRIDDRKAYTITLINNSGINLPRLSPKADL